MEDKEIAEKLLRDLEEINKKKSAFDHILGIWAKCDEKEEDLTKSLRRKSNLRNG